jgi:hypothetical protein
MSQRWQTLQRVMLSPGKIGDIAKAALSWCYSSTDCSRKFGSSADPRAL